MHAAFTKHPDDDLLAQFVQGRLGPDVHVEIENHILGCTECCKRLESLPGDTLAEQVRNIETRDGPRGGASPRRSPEIPPELRDHPRYRVIRPLGAGGMGAVFQAEHRRMERMVALKVIHRELLDHPTALERFQREVKSAAQLSHPNIVAAHDADEAGDIHFLVMEYVDGASLARVVEKRGPLPVTHACHYARQAALGLQHAFEKGMVHRDIKPQNLMLTKSGKVKIVDFGIACLARTPDQDATVPGGGARVVGAGITHEGTVLGTPDYMAPEQADNARIVDIRADIYALGGTLFFLLTGRPPYHGPTLQQTLRNHLSGKSIALREANPEVPATLEKVVHRMMAREPADRYQTPEAVAAALAPFIKSAAETVAEQASPPSARKRRPVGRRTLLMAGGGIALVVVALVLAAMNPFGGGIEKKADKENPPVPRPVAVPLAAPSTLAGKPVLVLVPQRFNADDYRSIVGELRAASVAVKTVSSSRLTCQALKGGEPREVVPDFAINDAGLRAQDFSALVVTGGQIHEFKDDRPPRDSFWKLLGDMNAAGRPVAGINEGVIPLWVAGQLKGKKVANNKNFNVADQKLGPSGAAEYVNEPVVVDGALFTAAAPDNSAPEVGAALARKLAAAVGAKLR